MKIAILNECFFDKNHLAKFREIGDLIVYNDTDSEDKAITRLKDIEIAVADGFIAPLNKKVLESAQQLKFLAINSTGYDVVDIKTAREKGIKVANTPGFSTEAVAEHAIALMFAAIKKLPLGDKEVREKPFEVDPANSNHKKYVGFNVLDKTLGVIGLGSIGSRVAELGKGLGMKVVAYNRTSRKVKDVEMLSLEEVLKQSDVVTIHLALNKETENVISKKELEIMKTTAIIINTARGKHINANDLYEALKNKRIAGAGLDTLADWSVNNPLIKLNSVVFSPHSAWYTTESLKNLADTILKNVENFVSGNPANIVS